MTAVFSDFDSTMVEKVVVDSGAGTVDVTFRNSGSTYRYALPEAEISDIVNLATARSKGKLLHQLLDIRNGERVVDVTASNVATPKVSAKPVAKQNAKVATPSKAVKPATKVAQKTARAKKSPVSRSVTI